MQIENGKKNGMWLSVPHLNQIGVICWILNVSYYNCVVYQKYQCGKKFDFPQYL